MKIWKQFLILLLLLGAVTLPVRAEESVYCFSGAEFKEEIRGICLKTIPKDGKLLLGNRVLRPGDVLTPEQIAKMTFCSSQAESGEITYLPVFADRVEDRTTAVFSLGRSRNQAPIAEDSALETYKNLENTGLFRVTDPEEEPMTIEVLRKPRRGTVEVLEGGSFTYTPKKNKVGVDSFTYAALDPAGNRSREATVTVTVLKPSDAARYQDTASMTCSFAAEWMKHTGIFTGEQLGDMLCFHPERKVSRGEFLTMLLKTLEIPEEKALTAGTEDAPLWLRPYLAAAIRSGLTAGLPDRESFSEEISQEEAAVLVQNALDLPVPAFSPSEEAPSWAAPALRALETRGIRLKAGLPLDRAGAAELLYGVHALKAAS